MMKSENKHPFACARGKSHQIAFVFAISESIVHNKGLRVKISFPCKHKYFFIYVLIYLEVSSHFSLLVHKWYKITQYHSVHRKWWICDNVILKMPSLNNVELAFKSGKGWVSKNWCFWTVVLEKTLESPLDSKEIKPVNPKGYQPWIFIGRTDAEVPILWPPDAKSQLLENTLMLAKTEGRKRRGQQRMGWLDGITDSMDVSLSKCGEMVKDRKAWRTAVHGVENSWTWLSNWTTTTTIEIKI